MTKIISYFTLTVACALIIASCESKTNVQSDISNATENTAEPVAVASSGDCDGYYPMTKGVAYEVTSYDNADKVQGLVNYSIIDEKEITNGLVSTIQMEFKDDQGNVGMSGTFDSKCENGNYYLNLEGMFAQLTSQYEAQGMKVTIDNGIAVIPNNLAVGDKLEDATMTIKMSATISMEMSITISDRIVEAKETITTPAGTFDCLILSQNTTVKMGDFVNTTSGSKDWIAKGIGNVKSENYDKDGKKEGYSLLTKFSK